MGRLGGHTLGVLITDWFGELEGQRGQDDSGAVAVGELVQPGRDRAELLEACEASFDHVHTPNMRPNRPGGKT